MAEQRGQRGEVPGWGAPELMPHSYDEWWGDSSCSSCSDSEYDEWPVTWHEDISSRAELFYVECAPHDVTSQKNVGVSDTARSKKHKKRDSSKWRKGAQGTLLKLMHRHTTRQQQISKPEITKSAQQPGVESRSKVTFHDTQSGEVREVRMLVEPRKHNLGRRASLCEALLGLVPGHFSEQPPHNTRIMVAGFIPDTEAIRLKKIKIGDWLHSIDGQPVFHQNVDQVLGSITAPCTVTLRLQRIAGYDVTQHRPPYLLARGVELEQMLQSTLTYTPGAMQCMLLVCDTQEPDSPQDQLVYCYPNIETSPVKASKGLFLTLLQLIPEYTQTSPSMSSVLLGSELVNILYWQEENNLILLAVPETIASGLAAKALFYYFMKAITFSYQSLTRCVMEKKSRLDLFVACMLNSLVQCDSGVCIKDVLPAVHALPLPLDTQTDVNNVLAEFESADFKDEMNYNTQRMFTILGSCLFYKGWSVCSHLAEGVLQYVHALLWLHGLCSPSSAPVRKMLAWIPVYLPDVEVGEEDFSLPPAQHFILLLGQDHKILAVLLESGGCTLRTQETLGPDIVYVQQAQATLDALHELGITDIIENWFSSQSTAAEQELEMSSRSSSRMLSSTSTKSLAIEDTGSSKTNTSDVTSTLYKSHKMASILKPHKSGRTSENSEDTCSQSASEGMRRPISDTSSEDSWAAAQESSVESSLQEGTVFTLGQAITTKLVEDNASCLYHFIHVECDTGVILSPVRGGELPLSAVMGKLRATCKQLRAMLHMDKSGVAVTELAVSWQYSPHSELAENSPVYWVVGRHFKEPRSREVYVCYQDTISINLVELGFRLALSM